MAKGNYVETNDIAFSAQLQGFKGEIGGYAAQLGVTPAQIAAQAADADYFDYCLKCQGIMQNSAQQWTTWKETSPAMAAPRRPQAGRSRRCCPPPCRRWLPASRRVSARSSNKSRPIPITTRLLATPSASKARRRRAGLHDAPAAV